MALSWKEEYRLGLDDIDRQHKKFFEMSGALRTFLEESRGQEFDTAQLVWRISDFRQYAFYHFHTEESLMVRMRFPAYFEHRDAHNEYLNKINTLLARLETAYHEVHAQRIEPEQLLSLGEEICTFVESWLGEHILKIDMEYAVKAEKATQQPG